jgi:cell division septation protein DedD
MSSLYRYATVFADYALQQLPLTAEAEGSLQTYRRTLRLPEDVVRTVETTILRQIELLRLLAANPSAYQLAIAEIVSERVPASSAEPASTTPPEIHNLPRQFLMSSAGAIVLLSVCTAVVLILAGVAAVSLFVLPETLLGQREESASPKPVPDGAVKPAPTPAISTTPETAAEPILEATPTPNSEDPVANAVGNRCQSLQVDCAFLKQLSATAMQYGAYDRSSAGESTMALLDALEQGLDQAPLAKLGKYNPQRDRDRQLNQIRQLRLKASKVYAEANRRVSDLVPRWPLGTDMTGTGLDQLWFAMVDQILLERESAQLEPAPPRRRARR